jgi:hypothetical protein
MSKKIKITAGSLVVDAELNDIRTASAVWDALPIQANGSTWGDEVYFRIPVEAELENGQEVVELGDLGYWPPGQAFCLFFDPTPTSQGVEVRPANEVTVIGKISGDSGVLKGISSGSSVLIEAV